MARVVTTASSANRVGARGHRRSRPRPQSRGWVDGRRTAPRSSRTCCSPPSSRGVRPVWSGSYHPGFVSHVVGAGHGASAALPGRSAGRRSRAPRRPAPRPWCTSPRWREPPGSQRHVLRLPPAGRRPPTVMAHDPGGRGRALWERSAGLVGLALNEQAQLELRRRRGRRRRSRRRRCPRRRRSPGASPLHQASTDRCSGLPALAHQPGDRDTTRSGEHARPASGCRPRRTPGRGSQAGRVARISAIVSIASSSPASRMRSAGCGSQRGAEVIHGASSIGMPYLKPAGFAGCS